MTSFDFLEVSIPCRFSNHFVLSTPLLGLCLSPFNRQGCKVVLRGRVGRSPSFAVKGRRSTGLHDPLPVCTSAPMRDSQVEWKATIPGCPMPSPQALSAHSWPSLPWDKHGQCQRGEQGVKVQVRNLLLILDAETLSRVTFAPLLLPFSGNAHWISPPAKVPCSHNQICGLEIFGSCLQAHPG